MGDHKALTRTEVACALTSDFNLERSTLDLQLSELGVES
jgi:hypothetical protein